MTLPFASLLNFLDPQLTNDGKPYGPERFKNIAKERYLISKHTNTSYEDTQSLSPAERSYILQFITEDLQREKEIYDKARNGKNS